MEIGNDRYIRLIQEGGIFAYSVTKGTFILPPRGLTLWQQMRDYLNDHFKKLGVENVLLPTLIPGSLISREQEHIEGFAPELFHVNKSSGESETNELTNSLVLRPTSEVLFYEWFSRILSTYRQLPLLYNQWVQVFRVEKNTKPFFRSVEFLWQEGHTLHSSKETAQDFCLKILSVYRKYAEELLCLSVVTGLKTSQERFAGALDSYTVEYLLPDHQCLQLATSHYFGEKFSKTFGVKFRDDRNNLQFPFSTSWGSSTRVIGALVSAHSDELGLVFPFKIAPCQIAFICYPSSDDRFLNYALEVEEGLSSYYRCRFYNQSRQMSVNFSNADKDGCALKIITGPKEIMGNFVSISLRTSPGERVIVEKESINEFILKAEQEIAAHLRKQSTELCNSGIFSVKSREELDKMVRNKKGMFTFPFCNLPDCENQIRRQFPSFSFRCIDNFWDNNLKCLFCSESPVSTAYFGRSY